MTLRTVAIVLACLTFALIVWGGHVNSTNSGMAFPDWPTSNASPMLTYAPSKWIMENDKFWEHGHRLFASLVGVVTVTLCVMAWRATPEADRPNTVIMVFLGLVLVTVASAIVGLQSMPSGFMEGFMIALAATMSWFLLKAFRSRGQSQLLWFALAAFATVCLQGAFGGYTVRNNLPVWTSTMHGILAQAFFNDCTGNCIDYRESSYQRGTVPNAIGYNRNNLAGPCHSVCFGCSYPSQWCLGGKPSLADVV